MPTLDILNFELAKKLLETYLSPLYVYSEEVIIRKVQTLLKAAHGFRISYALKANTNRAIITLIKQLGVNHIDVVSPGEIYKALQCGYKPQDILYTENFISDEDIQYALKVGVMLNIGALSTLENYGELLRGKEIFIRVNPKIGAGETYQVITGGPKSKFGIYETELPKLREVAAKYEVKVVGIHQHIGSNLKSKDEEVFLQTTRYTFGLLKDFCDVKFVNVGGGLGVKYQPHETISDPTVLYEQIRSIGDSFSKELHREIQICIEPGRYLVCQSGILLCRITAKKRTPECIFYGTDTGFNHLIRPTLYGSHHQIINLTRPDADKQTVTVCGNICECTDILGRGISLGGEVGDILSIQNVGAYGFSMSSNYNERPKPAQVLLRGRKDQMRGLQLIRRRETFEDLAQKL